jgi:hypothetical protein
MYTSYTVYPAKFHVTRYNADRMVRAVVLSTRSLSDLVSSEINKCSLSSGLFRNLKE